LFAMLFAAGVKNAVVDGAINGAIFGATEGSGSHL